MSDSPASSNQPSPLEPRKEGAVSSLQPHPVSSVASSSAEVAVGETLLRVFGAHSKPGESLVDRAIAEKLTSDHITKVLELREQLLRQQHESETEKTRSRPALIKYIILVFLLFVMFFTWLALAYSKSEIVLPVITLLSGLVLGGIGGYGYAKATQNQKSNQEQ